MSAVMADPALEEPRVIRRSKKKLAVIAGAVLALVLALGAGTVVLLKQRAAHAAAADDDSASGLADPIRVDPKNAPIYLPLDPFVVNLADREADRYAQIGITLELDSGVSADQIKAYMPAIRSATLLILASKSSKDLLSREGKEELAQEIMREAVRPFGIEVPAPQPVTAAPVVSTPVAAAEATSSASANSAAASASGAASAAPARTKPVAKRRTDGRGNPIQRVHFSSFIIQ